MWRPVLGHVITFIALFMVINLIGGYYAQTISPEIVGFIHDDGIYAVLGKALAQGQGFNLIHLVSQPEQVKYPIGYPLILALGWLMDPVFPRNLFLLTNITLLFSLLSMFLIFYYLTSVKKIPGWLAFTIMLMCAGNFYFMYFSTSVMSEAPYLFFTLLTLFYAETKLKNPTLTRVLIAVVLSACAFHVRILAFTLIAAISLWLWLNRPKKWALLYGGLTTLLTAVPWAIWTKTNTPAELTPITYPIYKAYGNYGFEMLENYSEKNLLDGILQTIGSFIHKLLEVMFQLIPNFLKIFPKLENVLTTETYLVYLGIVMICAYVLLGYFILQLIMFAKEYKKNRDLSQVSMAALYVVFYILACSVWKYDAQMTRFLVILTPWLWYYFFKPFLPAIQTHGYKKAWPQLAGMAVIIALCLGPSQHAYGGVYYSREKNWVDMGKYPQLWDDYKASFVFINTHLPKNAVLACEEDVLYYLYTNRLTYYAYFGALKGDGENYTTESLQNLIPSTTHYGVDYVIVEPMMKDRMVHAPENPVALYILENHPNKHRLIYTSPTGMIKIYRLLPPSL